MFLGKATTLAKERLLGELRPNNSNVAGEFAGQTVGVKQTDERIWLVSFMNYDLGHFDGGGAEVAPDTGRRVLSLGEV